MSALAALVAATGCTYNFSVSSLPARDAGSDGTDIVVMGDVQDVSDTMDVPQDRADAQDIQDVPQDIPRDIPQDMVLPDVPCGGACTGTQMCCDNVCVDTQSNPDHCGNCTTVCPGTGCNGGTCTGTCRLGFLSCDNNVTNGCEVNAATNNDHCGGCDTVCGAGKVCVGGGCVCAPGTQDCDGNPTTVCETNVNTDATHCGNCTTRCGTGQSCVAGACACSMGLADCDSNAMNGCEVDTQTSAANCGMCGHSCQPGEDCVSGACQCHTGRVRCPADALDCNTLLTDPDNCGGCGIVCAAAQVCGSNGTTTACTTMCASGLSICSRACVDLRSDVRNCGACGTACGANQTCQGAGTTSACACSTGFADCNTTASDGCEVNTQSDVANCGGCAHACAAGQVCTAGVCQCPTGLRDCGGGVCAACCDDSQCNDGNNCTTDTCSSGTCSHGGCATGTTCCGGSACRECCGDMDCSSRTGNLGCAPNGTCTTCAPGFADCNNDMTDGCEVRIDTTTNCGRCGNACSFANASAACTLGACTIVSCNTGFENCDMNPVNGCEANLQASVANCGMCGRVCAATAPASPTCGAGVCGTVMCPTGFGECDGNAAVMCEANLNTDTQNCSTCGNACNFPNAMSTCTGGACMRGACLTGFQDCNGLTGDGCEVNTQTDPDNCGSCGINCFFPHARSTCGNSLCRIGACDAGWANCNGDPTDGCETDLTQPSTCGSCTNRCPARANARTTCSAGFCGYACLAPFNDCDGAPANGCETNLTTYPRCGSCGASACSAGTTSGTCTYSSSSNSYNCVNPVCDSIHGNCDGAATNGCETDLTALATCGWSQGPGMCRTVNCVSWGACSTVYCSTGHPGCPSAGCP